MAVDSIRHGEDELKYYEIGACVVMPNHVYLLIAPRVKVHELMRRLKGHTARQASRIAEDRQFRYRAASGIGGEPAINTIATIHGRGAARRARA